MNELIAAIAKLIVQDEAFVDAVRKIFVEGAEAHGFIERDELKDVIAEEVRAIRLDLETQVTEAVEEAIKEAGVDDIDDKVNELIEEYFRDGPKFHISLARVR